MVTGRYSRGLVQQFDAHLANETANKSGFREIADLEARALPDRQERRRPANSPAGG